MKLKKLAALMMTGAMAVSMLAGCSGNSAKPEDTGKQTTAAGQADAATQAPAGEDTQAPAADAQGDGEQIVLRYAAWDLGTEEENNIFRRMIAEYEKRNPNIKIEIATDIDTQDWVGSLTTAAAGGNLPDVAMISELPLSVANDWALDVTPYIQNDADWANIPAVLSESGKYGSGTYGVPSGMNISGLYINLDLFEAKNQQPLSYGYSFEDFDNALKNMSAPSEGIIAIKAPDMSDWYAAVKDPSYGWYTYADGQVKLNDPLYIEGIKYSKSIYENAYCFTGLSDEQKANFGVDNDWDAFNAGKIAMTIDPTSNATGYAKLAFKTKFVGLPDGKAIIIPDYYFISKTSQHPQEAYDFAKFMSFGKDGIMAKLDAIEADATLSWGSLPLNNDKDIIDRFFANYPVEGVQEVYENLEGNGIVEAFKFTPGYVNARWNASTGIKAGENDNATIGQVIEACIKGELNIDDYAEQLNTLANASIKEVADVIAATVQ